MVPGKHRMPVIELQQLASHSSTALVLQTTKARQHDVESRLDRSG